MNKLPIAVLIMTKDVYGAIKDGSMSNSKFREWLRIHAYRHQMKGRVEVYTGDEDAIRYAKEFVERRSK